MIFIFCVCPCAITPHRTVDKLFAIDKACNGNAGVGVSHGCTCSAGSDEDCGHH